MAGWVSRGSISLPGLLCNRPGHTSVIAQVIRAHDDFLESRRLAGVFEMVSMAQLVDEQRIRNWRGLNLGAGGLLVDEPHIQGVMFLIFLVLHEVTLALWI